MNGDLFSAMTNLDHEVVAIHRKQWLAQMVSLTTSINCSLAEGPSRPGDWAGRYPLRWGYSPRH